MELNQIEKFLHRKKKITRVKRQLNRMEENVSQLFI
jgi:hypothetical protein